MKTAVMICLALLSIIPTITIAQIQPKVCADPLNQYVYNGPVQRGGLYMTSIGDIRVLVVFVQFNGDTYDPGNPNWPVNQHPAFFNTFIDASLQNPSYSGNISHYYRKMSFDQFRLYGDPYFVITQYPESYYRNQYQNEAYGAVNREVLQTLDSQVDYSLYDNWVFDTYNQNHYQGHDNVVDLIIMYYRTLTYPGTTTGIATLGQFDPDIQLDGRIIKFGFPSSGITNNGGTTGMSLYSTKHEIGHLLFGAGHPTHGNFPNQYGFWGIMTSNPHLSITAFERQRLRWIDYNDRAVGQSFGNIPDFITQGVAYRIRIPGTNEAFILENHQKIDTWFDDPNYIWPGKGLFMYRISDTAASHPNYNLMSGDGDADWSNPYWIHSPYSAVPTDSLPVFRRGSANRDGLDGRDAIPHTKGGSERIFALDVNGQYQVHERLWGDEKDAFNIGYNQVFSRWSNPVSKTTAGTLTDVAVEVTGKSTGPNGEDIFVATFYNGSGYPIQAAPSKPINLQATKNSQNAGSLTWPANLETDVTGYNVYRAIYYSGGPMPTYTKVNGSPVTTTSYVDNNWINFSLPTGTSSTFRYRITAVDNQAKESVKSDSVEVSYTYQEFLLGMAYQNKSTDPGATWHNGGRHVVKRNGKIHETFFSGGEVFYRRQDIATGNWEITRRVSPGNLINGLQSMCVAADNSLHVVWQGGTGPTYQVWYSRSTDNGATWIGTTPLCSNISVSSYQGCTYPVIAELNSPQQIVVVFTSTAGLQYMSSTNHGVTWSSPSGIQSNGRPNEYIWYLSMASGSGFLTLTYDYRYYGVWSRTYTGSSWTSEANVNVNTGTVYDRHSSVAIDGYFGGPIAAWCAQQSGESEYRILWRRGYSNNTWDSWFVKFPKVTGISCLYPSITFVNTGGENPYSVNIGYHRTDQQLRLTTYNYVDYFYNDCLLSSSGQWANTSMETATSGAPVTMWTDQSGNPYSVQLWSGQCGTFKVAATNYDRRRCVVLQHQKDLSTLSVEVHAINVVTTSGDTVRLPFKPHDMSQPLAANLENAWDYVGTEMAVLPPNAKWIALDVAVDAQAHVDTLGKAGTNSFASRSLRVDLIKGNTTAPLIVDAHGSSARASVDISKFAGQEVIIRPSAAVPVDIAQKLIVGVGDVFENNENLPGPKVAKVEDAIPQEFALVQNYPNPFNPSTMIKYALPFAGKVVLSVYDVLGREVAVLANGYHDAGYYSATWNASSVASGVYFTRFTVTDELGAMKFNKVSKLLLVK